jgi:hypothetical protein
MKRRLLRWGTVLAIATALIVPAGVLLNHWTNGSSTGAVHMGTPTTATQAEAAAPADPIGVTSTYFSTTLPSSFTIKRQQEFATGGPILLQLVANTASTTDQQFAVTVGTTPTDGLAGIASYHLRVTDTTTYSAYTSPTLPSGTVAFRTRSGPAALTIFWPRGDRYVELAFSSDGGTSVEPLELLYAHVLDNWKWK